MNGLDNVFVLEIVVYMIDEDMILLELVLLFLVKVDLVNMMDWKYLDDILVSMFIDRDGIFCF